MALADELGAIRPVPPTLDGLLDELEETDRKALLSALEDRRRPHTAIAKVLSENGYPISDWQVRRWRQAHQ